MNVRRELLALEAILSVLDDLEIEDVEKIVNYLNVYLVQQMNNGCCECDH